MNNNDTSNNDMIARLYESLGESHVMAPDVAHVEIHGNKVLGLHLVPGLDVQAEELEDGIRAEITVAENTTVEKPVRICFGMLPETGVQKIYMTTRLEDYSSISIVASCTFPNAVDVRHTMEAEIHIGKGAEYAYLERHVHGDAGGVAVIPRAAVYLDEGARFRTDFELIQGRVGHIDMEYEAFCGPRSILEMSARINGTQDDYIAINEKAHLQGEGAHGVLMTNIAVRDNATAKIQNTMAASAPEARGHVDCKEIVQGNATASAIPVVEVKHSRAHVTHEASVGSVDSKQLETLMSRGLNENEATDMIIQGLLTPSY
ncbi:MAG: SufD family Fe-S cluster assembly protein [Thermodesulfobacteriota bacterium]|nr:SufD family Fe-S cluster assembly protein [Thermodesulfobacteriota bacterium]